MQQPRGRRGGRREKNQACTMPPVVACDCKVWSVGPHTGGGTHTDTLAPGDAPQAPDIPAPPPCARIVQHKRYNKRGIAHEAHAAYQALDPGEPHSLVRTVVMRPPLSRKVLGITTQARPKPTPSAHTPPSIHCRHVRRCQSTGLAASRRTQQPQSVTSSCAKVPAVRGAQTRLPQPPPPLLP